MLFPVANLDDQHSVLRANGCQTIEMPAIQLLHLLPGYNGIDTIFHWVPNELANALSINSSDIEYILKKILRDFEVIDENIYNLIDTDGFLILQNPKSEGKLKITPMDDKAHDFYALYSNIASDEIKTCQSMEVDTLLFLNTLKEHLIEGKKPQDAIKLVEEMIANEEKRLGNFQDVKNQLAQHSITKTFNTLTVNDPKPPKPKSVM